VSCVAARLEGRFELSACNSARHGRDENLMLVDDVIVFQRNGEIPKQKNTISVVSMLSNIVYIFRQKQIDWEYTDDCERITVGYRFPQCQHTASTPQTLTINRHLTARPLNVVLQAFLR